VSLLHGLGRFQFHSALMLCLAASSACKLPEPKSFTPAEVQRGAVVSEHPLATGVGIQILERGGNAADAAAATALALAVVYPQAGNLGGGGFAICAGPDDAPLALDFREVAPRSTDAELYLDQAGDFVSQRSIAGPLAVGVPGSPRGLYELYSKRGSGKLRWEEIVAPAIALARDGFAVDPWLARDLAGTSCRARMNPAALDLFYPEGSPLREGELLVQSDLARTLTLLAEFGPEGFYEGEVAQALLDTVANVEIPGAGLPTSGIITASDLKSYRSVDREPLIGYFEGHELIGMPPPSSGGLVILQALAILEGLPLGGELDQSERVSHGRRPSALLTHWCIEALRRSFADRAEHMGDPDFHEVPVAELLSTEWILERRNSIGRQADLNVGAWVAPIPEESRQTTHLSVVDTSGNAVSLTTTLNGSFGSGIVVPGAGFLLNNELDDFSIQAGVPNQFGLIGNDANSIQAGKRPLSSMSPMIVRDNRGSVRMVLGSPGGPRIITAVFQVLVRVLLLDESLGDAVRANRMHQQWRPKATLFEAREGGGPGEETIESLRQRGHPIEVVARRFGSVQAILIDEFGEPVAVSDPRRGGAAAIVGRGIQAAALPLKR
jgi:gamma-glutamyltranspeptidase/glutathione hydrolase